jgi:GntR family transcriptional repressor for pyruvate dehydrogenase complex
METARTTPTILEPIRRLRLHEEAAEQITTLIREGKLRPGDRLPSERDLVNQLLVSRTSVREALRTLEILGFIEVRPGEGAFVREVGGEALIHPLTTWLLSRRGHLLQLIEARLVLEPELAALAAQRATTEHLATMQTTLATAEASYTAGDLDGMASAIALLHQHIAASTGNPILTRIMDAIATLLSDSMAKTLRIPGRPTKSLAAHRAILAAVAARDATLARTLMRQHLDSLQADIMAPPIYP